MNKTSPTDKIILYIETLLHPEMTKTTKNYPYEPRDQETSQKGPV